MSVINARAARVSSEADSYQPPSYLVSLTLLPIKDLIRQYEVFKNATQYISAAPELVFERLISSIGEAYTTRHHIRHIQEPGTDVQSADTITTSIEQISTSIEALRDAVAAQQHHGNIATTDAAAQFLALLAEFHGSLPGSSPSDTIGAQLTLPQAKHNMRITINFASDSTNTGIILTNEDPAMIGMYATSPPWADIHQQYPDAQWGNQTWTAASGFHGNQQITFSQGVKTPTSVICWLTGFETTDMPLRARVRTSRITSKGFMLHVEPRTLRSVGVAWLAGLPRDQVGQFDANSSGMWTTEQQHSTSFTGTGQGKCTRLAVAITQVDIGGTPAFPLKLEPLFTQGCASFSWRMRAGAGDEGLYLLKGAFMIV